MSKAFTPKPNTHYNYPCSTSHRILQVIDVYKDKHFTYNWSDDDTVRKYNGTIRGWTECKYLKSPLWKKLEGKK